MKAEATKLTIDSHIYRLYERIAQREDKTLDEVIESALLVYAFKYYADMYNGTDFSDYVFTPFE
jgi:hypothetical protein